MKKNVNNKESEDAVLRFHAKHKAKEENLMERILTDQDLAARNDIFELYQNGPRHTMKVGPEEGAYTTLEDAIREAKPFTTIYLTEGAYTCKVPITKNGLIIEKRDKEKDVFILGCGGPVVTVALEEHHFVVFKKITFMHTGANFNTKFKESATQQPKYSMNPNTQALREFDIERGMETILWLETGGLMTRDCIISFQGLPKGLKSRIPAVVAKPNTVLNLTTTQLLGGDGHCGGVIILNANCQISDCEFRNFNAGCIYSIAKSYHKVIIQDTLMADCKVVGVYCQGEGARQKIQRMTIRDIQGPGIKIARGNYGKIIGNDVSGCASGVEAISSQPLIAMNKFHQNYENGIVTKAKNDLRCDAIIRFNTITQNKGNGILCTGKNNHTRVEKNLTIAQNKFAGIKTSDFATVVIQNNEIMKNYGQGILLVESTNAHIEKNVIKMNYKANIAFGGDMSCDTTILQNEISEGRCEGIFGIETGFAWIIKNRIFNNSDGIVIFDSATHIAENKIMANQRAGIVLTGCSFPKIEVNEIFGNAGSGVNIRDSSRPILCGNKFYGNYYQISARAQKQSLCDEFVSQNTIEGDNEFCANCSIF